MSTFTEKLEHAGGWSAPKLPPEIPHGDMPGDKVEINEGHVRKAAILFPELLKEVGKAAKETDKVVVAVCGGSGVGKSEIASLLSYYFHEMGIGSYTLSGDNYPHRIPKYNDAERLRVFRESGIRGMVREDILTGENFKVLHKLQTAGEDADRAHAKEYPWLSVYQSCGREGLSGYLGTKREIDFEGLEDIIAQYKAGKGEIYLKRMGREDTELWYEKVDFSGTDVLVIEWTHGNSDCYRGVDIPVLLNSTPQETLAHRRARNRDGATDSPFTTMVLELEQKLLEKQAPKAKLIISKDGELLSFEEYRARMDMSRDGGGV